MYIYIYKYLRKTSFFASQQQSHKDWFFNFKNSFLGVSKKLQNDTFIFVYSFLSLKHSFEKSCFWDSKIAVFGFWESQKYLFFAFESAKCVHYVFRNLKMTSISPAFEKLIESSLSG